jgi:hypothetical protein
MRDTRKHRQAMRYLPLFLALCIASPAWAQEHKHTPEAEQADHHAGHEMPEGAHSMNGMHEDGMHAMRGMYGDYSMTRESSGTAWVPDSSLMEGVHGQYGEWMTMVHGFANFVYDDQGGRRGDEKTFSESMLMGMGQRSLGEGTLGLRGMLSLDALMGKGGYPLVSLTYPLGDYKISPKWIDYGRVRPSFPWLGLTRP